MPAVAPTPVPGIDVSVVQGAIAWGKIPATTARFAYIKCGNGNDGYDVNYRYNVVSARAAGLTVGAYHFFYPLHVIPGKESRDAKRQAVAHFKASAFGNDSGGLGVSCGDLPPACDVEWPPPEEWKKWGLNPEFIRDSAYAYMCEVEALYRRTPMLYTYPYFARAVTFDERFKRFPLWLANYTRHKVIIPPWDTVVMQQTTGGGGRLPNGAPVDTNTVADEETFRALVSGGFEPQAGV